MLGQSVEERVSVAFEKLPSIMARADARAGQIERAVVDLAETVLLSHREGEVFSAVVTDTDDRGSRIQLRDVPVVARIIDTGLLPGSALNVRLTGIDAAHRLLHFAPV
jgi:exoribonuclease R